MFCVPTRKTRRFIGAFTRGMEFPAAFNRIMTEQRIRCARIHLSGHLETATVAFEPRGEIALSHATLLQGSGFISDVDGQVVPCLSGIFQFSGPLGPQVVGGRLVAARFAFAEFDIEVFDDLFVVRQSDPRYVIPPWTDCLTETPAESSSASPGAPVHAAPPGAAGEEEEEGEDGQEESILPAPGDFVDHFRFGLCRVQRIDGGDILEVITPAKNKARLSMSVLRFELAGTTEDGSRRFKARPARER